MVTILDPRAAAPGVGEPAAPAGGVAEAGFAAGGLTPPAALPLAFLEEEGWGFFPLGAGAVLAFFHSGIWAAALLGRSFLASGCLE